VERELIRPYSPLSFPGVILVEVGLVSDVSKHLALVQKFELVMRLIYDRPPPLLKEPGLRDHNAERRIPHATFKGNGKRLRQDV
jgi:hypothetical protein